MAAAACNPEMVSPQAPATTGTSPGYPDRWVKPEEREDVEVGRIVFVGSGLTETGDADIDDVGALPAHLLVRQAPPFQHASPEVLDHYIAHGDEVLDQV